MRIITGKARGLKLTVPKNMDVRPTADRVKEFCLILLALKLLAHVCWICLPEQVIWGWSRGAAALLGYFCR